MTNNNNNCIIADNPLIKHANRQDEEDYLNIIYSQLPEFERKQAEKYKHLIICQEIERQKYENLNYNEESSQEVHEIPILIGKININVLLNYLKLEKCKEFCAIKIDSNLKNIKSQYLREILSPFRKQNYWVIFRYRSKEDRLLISFHKPSLYTFFIKEIGWVK